MAADSPRPEGRPFLENTHVLAVSDAPGPSPLRGPSLVVLSGAKTVQ